MQPCWIDYDPCSRSSSYNIIAVCSISIAHAHSGQQTSFAMEGADAAEGFVVGARCCFDGYYATTRFVGEVPPAKGI